MCGAGIEWDVERDLSVYARHLERAANATLSIPTVVDRATHRALAATPCTFPSVHY